MSILGILVLYIGMCVDLRMWGNANQQILMNIQDYTRASRDLYTYIERSYHLIFSIVSCK